MITEEFRHLDTSIILSLVKARADINTTVQSENRNKPPVNWYKELVTRYAYFHWEDPLPWEAKKSNTLFNDNNSSLMNKQEAISLGPATLRKVVGPINVKVIEAARKNLPELTTYSYYTSDEYVENLAHPSQNMHVEHKNRPTSMAMSSGSGSQASHNSFLVPTNPDEFKPRSHNHNATHTANGSVYSGYDDASSVISGSSNESHRNNASRANGVGGGSSINIETVSVTSSRTTETSGSWGSFLSNVASTVTATASSAMGSDTDANRNQARQTPAGRGVQREKSMFMKMSSMFGK